MPPSSYDVNTIFAEMEQELIASYRRNMARHAQEEVKAGFSWEMWQMKKLKDLQGLKKEARITINKYTKQAYNVATGQVVDSYTVGKETADASIRKIKTDIDDLGFGITDRRKVNAILDAVSNDFTKASHAALRLIDDQYRQIVFKAQTAFAAGATTLSKAIDIAAKDFLGAGINSITYKNGAKVNIASYSEMVLRTSAKRANLTGEGARNSELGVNLVQITSYGACSPTCLPWQGKVYVDDVYSDGKPDGKHQKLSFAMANGLFHPNCRHTSQPYFPGISTLPPKMDETKIREQYAAEQRQREIERNIRKYKRYEEGSVDPENKRAAGAYVKIWQRKMRDHLADNPFLSRRSYREATKGVPADVIPKLRFPGVKTTPPTRIPPVPKPAVPPAPPPIPVPPPAPAPVVPPTPVVPPKLTAPPPFGNPSLTPGIPEEITFSNILPSVGNVLGKVGAETYRQGMVEVAKRASPDVQRVMGAYQNALILNHQADTGFFSPGTRSITIDFNDTLNDDCGEYSTFFHELGHAIDARMTKPSADSAFIADMMEDFNESVANQSNYGDTPTGRSVISSKLKRLPNTSNGVSDVMGGISGGSVQGRWGHSQAYWTRNDVKKEASSELFAHMMAAAVNDESAGYIKEWFPRTWKRFNDIMAGTWT